MGWITKGVTLAALAGLAVLSAAHSVLADTVEMKDGTLIRGKYVGGTAGTIRVQVEGEDGPKVLETSTVLAVTFGDSGGAAPAAAAAVPAAAAATPAAAAPAPAPAAVPAAAVAPAAAAPTRIPVPAGTVLTIRLDGPVSSQTPEGTKFSGKLLADLVAEGQPIAKAGSTVYGQVDKSKQAGRAAGKSTLSISLTGIDMGGTIQPIMTTGFSETGKSSFRKTARNTAAGAVIGNAADDDDGGKKGAAIGAGVSLIRKGESVTAPAGMILEFRLSQPFEATVTK